MMIYIITQFDILLGGITLVTVLQKKSLKLSQNNTNYSTASFARGSAQVHLLLPLNSKHQTIDDGLAE
jgi:hypothetical protein